MTTTLAPPAVPPSTGTGVGMRSTGTAPPNSREIDWATAMLASAA
jgi:hypothetical protein